MELLSAIAGNLERHAAALTRLADELSRCRPARGSAAARHWDEREMEVRIDKMRREAQHARRALRRIDAARRRHGAAAPRCERAAA